MFTKEEASASRQKFWTSFGKYMSPIPGAEGSKVNWINYKTGVKQINFKMISEAKFAAIAVEISGEESMRLLLLKLFTTLGFQLLPDIFYEDHFINEHEKEISMISSRLDEVSIFRESDWPAIISFYKENILLFDAFWAEHKDLFVMQTNA